MHSPETKSCLVAQESSRQQQQCPQQGKRGFDAQPHQANGQGQQPDHRREDQDKQGKRPKQDKQDAPSGDKYECFHPINLFEVPIVLG